MTFGKDNEDDGTESASAVSGFNTLKEGSMIRKKTPLTLSVCLLIPFSCVAEQQYLRIVNNGEFNAVVQSILARN
jgi:hypothetical protein